MIKKTFIILLATFATFVFSGCRINYSFTGASIDPEVKTASVAFFPNQAPLAQPILSQAFTEALKDIFLSQTNLSLVQKGGDLHFEGAITGYSTSIVAVQGGNNAQASRNRLTITVNVKFVNSKNEKQNFETSFSRFADYDASQNFSSVEESLIKDINQQLVQDIFNRAVTNW